MSGRGKDGHGKRSGRPLITGEDLSLWQRIAASVRPLRHAKPRVPEVEIAADKKPVSGSASPPPKGPARLPPGKPPAGEASGGAKPAAVAASPLSAPSGRPIPPQNTGWRAPAPVPAVERRHARRIAAGAIEIDARLDLHGLTQSAAHDRLLGFLRGAAADGLKTVLVITGKGGARPVATTWDRGGDEIGVLRRSVPRWLAEPAFRSFVVGYQTAAQRHGGDGAFYIVLRRARSRPSRD